MKKFLAVLLTGMLLTTALIGCGSGDSGPKEPEGGIQPPPPAGTAPTASPGPGAGGEKIN